MRSRACSFMWALMLVSVFADPALAQTLDPITDLLDEWMDWGISTFGVFALLIGLAVALVIAFRNILAGITVGVAVIAFGALFGNYEEIASQIGLG